ncbi:MAG: hypothetical protein AB7V26_10805 [Lysobacterales bacterium]
MSTEVWLVGPEHEQWLFAQLGDALRALGYRLDDQWAGVAGSQEISRWVVSGPGGCLTVAAETYVGLTVAGPVELVTVLRERFSTALPVDDLRRVSPC